MMQVSNEDCCLERQLCLWESRDLSEWLSGNHWCSDMGCLSPFITVHCPGHEDDTNTCLRKSGHPCLMSREQTCLSSLHRMYCKCTTTKTTRRFVVLFHSLLLPYFPLSRRFHALTCCNREGECITWMTWNMLWILSDSLKLYDHLKQQQSRDICWHHVHGLYYCISLIPAHAITNVIDEANCISADAMMSLTLNSIPASWLHEKREENCFLLSIKQETVRVKYSAACHDVYQSPEASCLLMQIRAHKLWLWRWLKLKWVFSHRLKSISQKNLCL